MSYKNNASEIIRLNYTQSSYPGWKLCDKVPRSFTGPDGTIYRFKGLAVVRAISITGNRIEVEIIHAPGVDREVIGEDVN